MSKEEAETLPVAASTETASAETASPAAASKEASPVSSSPAVESPSTPPPAAPKEEAQEGPKDEVATTPAVPAVPAGNPKIAELQAMFPTVDVGVIEMVLESVSGSQDRAIESLLQMTDPDFKPEETTAEAPEENSQVDLDAEFARALAIQEEEDAREEQRRQRGSRNAPAGQLPYQPRVRRARPATGEEPLAASRDLPPGQGDQFAAFEEKAAQFVESGRQTFNSIFSQVKAKYSEYQAQTAQNAELRAQQHQQQQSEQAEQSRVQWNQEPITTQGYDTRPRSARTTSATSSQVSSQDSTPIRTRWDPSDSSDDNTPLANRRPLSQGADKPPASKIDLSKLGFLPKKRVDLMSSQQDRDPNPTLPGSGPSSPTPTTPTSANRSLVAQIPKTPPAETSHHTLGDSDDDDDLEYTKNPFDEK